MEWAGLSRVRVPREDPMGRAYGVCVKEGSVRNALGFWHSKLSQGESR